MKVLVSTNISQGQRKSDFCFVSEGEIVCYGFECSLDDKNIDDSCGCKRSLVGINSRTGTTTFKVAEWCGTEEEWEKKVEESFYLSGWERAIDCTELLKIADKYPVGTILEKRGDIIQHRLILL